MAINISVRPAARLPLALARGAMSEAKLEASAAANLVRTGGAGLWAPAEPAVLMHGMRPAPVMLVHGLGANSSCFQAMAAALHQSGHTVYLVNYSCLGVDVPSCGRQLAVEAARLRQRTGASTVHVVAHSLGGVVLRWAVVNTRMGEWVGTAVTLGSPHGGSPLARLAPARLPGFGLIISQLRPTRGDAPGAVARAARVRWVAVAAKLDWIVPPRFAALPESANVRNVVLSGGGHLSLPGDDRCVDLVKAELDAALEHAVDDAA
jgi:triacylglycerol lipase